jgi:hypothetical protein
MLDLNPAPTPDITIPVPLRQKVAVAFPFPQHCLPEVVISGLICLHFLYKKSCYCMRTIFCLLTFKKFCQALYRPVKTFFFRLTLEWIVFGSKWIPE